MGAGTFVGSVHYYGGDPGADLAFGPMIVAPGPNRRRRRWPMLVFVSLVFVILLLVLTACGSADGVASNSRKIETAIAAKSSEVVRIDMGPDTGDVKTMCWNGYRIFVTANGSSERSLSGYGLGASLFVVVDPACKR